MPFRHIVMFRFYDEASEAQVRSAERTLAGLGERPGVLSFVVRRSEDERKGRVVVENALFEDRVVFEEWLTLPEHRAAGEQLSELADWWIADYPE